MRYHSTEGSLSERIRLVAKARKAGATIRWPFRLPHGNRERPADKVEMGRGVWIGPGAWLNLNGPDARLRVGAGSVIGADLTVGGAATIAIGEGCLFSARVTLLDQLHDFEDWLLPALAEGRTPHFSWALTPPEPVTVGAGTWIGIGVVVTPGVTIGEGCVIGANSVVTADVPPYSVVAGVPARVIRSVGERPAPDHS